MRVLGRRSVAGLLARAVLALALVAGGAHVEAAAHAAPGSTVRVAGSHGAWRLLVDGKPWQVRGVTFGDAQSSAPQRMADLHALGVNTVRIWGVDDVATPKLLRAADRYGIKVIVGHWLDQGVDYATDVAYERRTRTEILRRVRALEHDRGVLMWDLGNEVLVGARSEHDRIAYARYVDALAVAIHRVDPRHPVTSTDAWTGAWRYYGRYAPHLDLYAVNAYAGIGAVYRDWRRGRYAKPYVVTESGPPGDWEVGKDRNGVPDEPSDAAAARAYTGAWTAIAAHPRVDLGGTLFDYGTHLDYAGVWFDLRAGGRRAAWVALRRAFTGRPTADAPPSIRSMRVPRTAGAGASFTVAARVPYPDRDAVTCTVLQSAHAIDGSAAVVAARAERVGACRFRVTAPKRPGVWRIYLRARDGHGDAAFASRTVRVG